MSVDEFNLATRPYVSGPEHNAFYDVDQFLGECLSVMTPEQRHKSFNNIKKIRRQRDLRERKQMLDGM